MRDLTTIEIDRIKLLTENSIEFCLIEPTETKEKTGMRKKGGKKNGC